MALAPGVRLGPYEIVSALGAGGMGEVYKARDTRLDRTVAIKVLPEHVASDPELKQRFEREAKTISSLNHPHICTLYDVGREGDTDFLVMEHLEGDTLAQRLTKGALPLDQALQIAIQIADALDKAHRQGIVHRDLKPGNIMLTKTGAKLLDFGLAKLRKPGTTGAEGFPDATTEDVRLTEPGTLMGTLPYMAPEQLEGQEADARTDIFAFGAVVHEMITGKRAFEGKSQASLISAILKDAPPLLSTVQPLAPTLLDHVLQRCLAKEPDDRWQSASDVEAALQWATTASDSEPTPTPRNASWLPWALAALTLGVALFAFLRPDPNVLRRQSEFVISLDAEMSRIGQPDFGVASMPLPSPDGRYIVFRGNGPEDDPVLWIRTLESVQAQPLSGTEGATGSVVWSPEGAWVGFFAEGRLKKVRPDGGPRETIAELAGFLNAAWGSQGDIVYRPTNRAPLYVVRDTGGSPRQVTRLDAELSENSHRDPEFLPDGRRFLFTSRSAERGNNTLYVGSLDSPDVRRVMAAEARVSYVPAQGDGPGTLFYYAEGALLARAFDTDSEGFVGEPELVTEDVSYNAASINAGFRVSDDGSVIVVRPAGGVDAQLTWFRRDGEAVGTVGSPGRNTQVRISPTGDAVLFQAPNPQNGNRDVWHTELARGITVRLTTHIANDWHPVWAPDGGRILFGSDREGEPQGSVYLKTSLDPGVEETLVSGVGEGAPRDWSRDGQWISYDRQGDLWIASPSRDVETFPFLATSASESNGRFSPDGRWIAYASNETGAWEVQVRPFEGGPTGTEGRIQISNAGGDFPVWGPDGRELFYLSADDVLYAVDATNLGAQASVPLPSRLFQACPGGRPMNLAATGQPYQGPYDTYDGERFLVSCRQEPVGEFLVLLDWAFSE